MFCFACRVEESMSSYYQIVQNDLSVWCLLSELIESFMLESTFKIIESNC